MASTTKSNPVSKERKDKVREKNVYFEKNSHNLHLKKSTQEARGVHLALDSLALYKGGMVVHTSNHPFPKSNKDVEKKKGYAIVQRNFEIKQVAYSDSHL